MAELQPHTLILFGTEYIPQEVLNNIKGESITHNVFRIQDNDSIMNAFYFITFIEYKLERKRTAKWQKEWQNNV